MRILNRLVAFASTAFALFFSLTLSLLAETTRTDSNGPLPPISLQSPALDPSIPLPVAVLRSKPREKVGTCWMTQKVLSGIDPVTETPWEIDIDDWTPRAGSKRFDRAVIVVPPTGGVNVLDENWSKQFCKKGVRTVLLRHWTGDLETGLDPNVHDRGSLRGIAAIRQTASFLKDHDRLSIFGTSLGAILSAMATGLETRIDRSVLLVAGGSITELLTESDQELLVDMRNRRMSTYGLKDSSAYRAFLKERLQLEPLSFAAPSPEKELTFLIGTEDTTVPTFTQVALWNAWMRPRRFDIESGHFGAILKAWLFYSEEVISGMGLH